MPALPATDADRARHYLEQAETKGPLNRRELIDIGTAYAILASTQQTNTRED